MTVETPERAWTDPRLDDLKKAVDGGQKEMKAGFARADKRMDAGFSALRGEMKAGYEKLDKKMDTGFSALRGEMKAGYDKLDEKMDAGFARLDSRFDGLIWALMGVGGVSVAGLLGIIGTLIAVLLS